MRACGGNPSMMGGAVQAKTVEDDFMTSQAEDITRRASAYSINIGMCFCGPQKQTNYMPENITL